MLIKCPYGNHYNWWPDDNYDGKPMGIGSFDLVESKSNKSLPLELWSFGIYKDSNRGKGYGQMMLREAMEVVGNRDVRLYVYRSNEVAIHIYEKAGFKITGKYMGDQAWVMTRFAEAHNAVDERTLCCA